MNRRVDKAATKAARAKQARGIQILNALFGASALQLRAVGDKHTGRPRPFRMRPNVPALRPDPAARARRRRRKIAHESRRRNR